MIKVWDFDFNQVPGKALPDYSDQDLVQHAFDFNIDLMASLEGRGFEGVFYSEHHFINSMSPCPNLLVAMLAARTSRLKIGVMGNVLPFHQPWRLAEELNMLDYITHGRLEIGVASGVPPEFLFVNIPQPDIRPMYTEILDFLMAAKDDSMVTLKGKYFDLEDIPIMPRPRKEARRRHWVTIYSEASCRDAARRDMKVCTGYQSVESAAAAFDGYRDEAAKLGRDVDADDVGIRRQVLIADTHAEAESLALDLQESAKARMAQTFALVAARLEASGVGPAESVKESGVIDAAAVPRGEEEADNIRKDMGENKALKSGGLVISPEEYISGSPTTVAEQIIDQCERLGAGNILAYHAPTLDEKQIARNYDLWEQVIPILQKAQVGKALAA
ncbi:LLM class flavin-dependent oxidoreductase [Croceicoccus bisphenolivorans]|uniref:LLM class flavin-dependent oxidoreductase n=1 Tax=Croceicoccus bisphenolivorans TaxID=1783232 RepID=UPI000832CEF2|nr:LLM class flavin-dependent oxidoreductase [Croceicoccus bisphenolivorans]